MHLDLKIQLSGVSEISGLLGVILSGEITEEVTQMHPPLFSLPRILRAIRAIMIVINRIRKMSQIIIRPQLVPPFALPLARSLFLSLVLTLISIIILRSFTLIIPGIGGKVEGFLTKMSFPPRITPVLIFGRQRTT